MTDRHDVVSAFKVHRRPTVNLPCTSTPVFREHSDWAPSCAADAIERMRSQHEGFDEGVTAAFAICPAGDPDGAVGEVSLNGIDRVNGVASIGYWLAPAGRGAGIATRAVRLLSAWGLRELGLNRISLTCSPDNAASAAVARRAGYSYEGRLRSHIMFKGRPRDSLQFSLLPADIGTAGSPSEPQ